MSLTGLTRLRRPFARNLIVATAALATATALTATGLALAGPASAAPAHQRPTMVLRDNANGKIVTVRTGETVDLILASSYWRVSGSSSSRVLHQNGPSFLLPRPSNCPHIPGLGCTPIEVVFSARTAGHAWITASRTSCGEALACAPSQRYFRVKIIVKK